MTGQHLPRKRTFGLLLKGDLIAILLREDGSVPILTISINHSSLYYRMCGGMYRLPKNSRIKNFSRPSLSRLRAESTTTRLRRCDSQLKSS